jgi:hypothetical protein
MHTSDLRLFFSRHYQASNVAGHSHGVQVPLGHMLTYMLTAHVRGRTCPGALHLIEGHSLISIRQEHDISARVLSTVTGDHEPDNALNWHSFSPRHRHGLTYILSGALAEIADSARRWRLRLCRRRRA